MLKAEKPIVFLVDENKSELGSLPPALEEKDLEVREYSSAKEFLANFKSEHGCLVTELRLPEMDGLQLQSELVRRKYDIPMIFVTGHGGVAESVKAIRGGAIGFFQKPFRKEEVILSIEEAITKDANERIRIRKENEIFERIGKLTDRERYIFDLLIEAESPLSSKVIARALGISYRTVEHHRSRILEKLGVRNINQLRRAVGRLSL